MERFSAPDARLVLALTRGKPSRMMDPKPRQQPLSDDEERSFRRRKRRVHGHQAAFLVIVLGFFAVYSLSGATFMD
jgi:hypothetical protein